jgi:hypothetical protein
MLLMHMKVLSDVQRLYERTTALKSLKGPEREEGQVKLTQR